MEPFDLHNDLLTSGLAATEIRAEAENYSRRLTGIVLALWSTFADRLPPARELPLCRGVRFAVEDMHFFREEMTEELLALRPVYCGLTWNYDNGLAGGALGDSRLTDRGKRLIKLLNGAGIAVDLAHLNRRSFFEAVELADRVLDSHTFISEIHAHPRNIDLDQAAAIARKRGVIGLCPVRAFTGGGTEAYIRGLDLVTQKFGDGLAAVGTDFHGSADFPTDLTGYDGLAALWDRVLGTGMPQESAEKFFTKNAAEFVAAGDKTK